MADAYSALLDLVGLSIAGSKPEDNPILTASVVEKLNGITGIRAIFGMPEDKPITLTDVVGKTAKIEMKLEEGGPRKFQGVIVSARYLGVVQKLHAISVEIRPWLWFLTRTSDNRIFQDMNAADIIKEVFSELGFSDHSFTISGSLPVRPYTVQYHESSFDFASRLMEEEGLAYYFDHSGTREKLVVTNSISGHTRTKTFKYAARAAGQGSRDPDTIFEWSDSESVVPGEVVLIDYDFTKPGTRLDPTFSQPRGNHSHKSYQHYRMDGRFDAVAAGETLAENQLRAQQVEQSLVHGASNIGTLAVGLRFGVDELPTDRGSGDFLLTECTHFFTSGEDDEELKDLLAKVKMEVPKGSDFYMNTFSAMPLAAAAGGPAPQYRPPQVTPWPDLSGLHTAVVTGPSGEEIYTDKYGRIKVQFHWDRDGKKDEKTTCFIRVMQPWAGKNWGMVSIPRIGQEVVIQFERNNPDRPICLGMLYNEFNMPPYGLPDNMTQTGIKTDSSKGGGGFNELVFEDKKGEEFVRLQSEKDYKETIKNNAEITVGLEKKDPGNMTMTVHKDLTEKLNTGDHTFTVDQGKQTVEIEKDQAITLRSGNQTIDIKSGKGTTTAMQSFEIKVGQSSILLEPAKITIKSTEILIKSDVNTKVEAGVNAEIKANVNFKAEAMVASEVKGSVSSKLSSTALAVVQAPIVNIN